MKLNADQKSAVERIVRFFTEEKGLGITLVGPGGSGKTTSIMFAVQELLDAGLKVLMSAPTNKAVKQLEKSAREFGLSTENVAFQTVHSALGLAMLPNEENKYATKVAKGVLPIFDVVIIDECSMLGKRVMYKHLLPECEEHGTRLLNMGDDMQLPPPLEDISPSFTEFEVLRLEKVERQAEGSEILSVAGTLRTAMLEDKPFKAPEPEGRNIEFIKPGHFLKELVEHFDVDTDLEEQRVLAWSNRRVNEVNGAIRKKLFGPRPPRFVEGERVVTGAPLKTIDGDILLSTDEECFVHNITESSVFDEHSGEDYKVYRLVLKPIYEDNVSQAIANVLHESERERYTEQLERTARMAKASGSDARKVWAQYWAFKELFADIRYCYCITIHRAQGSTFGTTFLDVKDVLRNNKRFERQRLTYVGYSRPRHRLLVNKRKFVA